MTNPIPAIDAAEVETMILTLGAIGAHSETGVWRTAFSDEWVAANALVKDWATAAGLTTRMDAAGNLWGRIEGRDGGKAIVSGSHIDSQCPGGRYDGALGVIAALVAIKTLVEAFGPPKRPLEMLSLCEEEGSRFPTAGFWGSRALVGRVSATDPDTVKEANGGTIGQAMQAVGLDPARLDEAKRDDIAAFVELHIEQGPVLEHADIPVAIVTGITAIRHTEVTLTGEQNHAGAFPMDLRRDPMAGFAEVTSRLIDHAYRMGRPAVTTVGRCHVSPNAPAIIPRSVTFTIDARHPIQDEATRMHAAHAAALTEIAERRGLGLETRVLFDHPGSPSDPALVAALEASAKRQGIPALHMASGAGHDAQQIARICPVAMVFVRSEGGRSHTPEEFSTIEDIVAGIQVLAGALYELAY
ncbi:MAG: Zn-dependent hydrolase [Flavimaricola sp.]|nr:Zn-dependent hydrolase [Flavimaricola sp.]